MCFVYIVRSKVLLVIIVSDIIFPYLDISPTDVYHHGSMPAKYLFNWISASSTVLEYIASSQKKTKPKVSISVENTNDPKRINE